MTYLVVYDIEDDRVRARMAKVLVGYDQRVQESVFECSLEAAGENVGIFSSPSSQE